MRTLVRLASPALVLLAISSVGCSGTGDGGGGDPLAMPVANPYGGGSRIHELLGPATWERPDDRDSAQCDSIPPYRIVGVNGTTVTAIDRFDETADGAIGNMYVQDSVWPALPYSGITVYSPSFSPPDLRVSVGDVVDLFGVLVEFPGPSTGYFSYCRTLPEIGGTMAFRFDGTPPTPTLVTASDLVGYAAMRNWLGVLVRLERVRLAADPNDSSSGRYSVRIDTGTGGLLEDQPTITNELFDLKNAGLTLAAGTELSQVTGIVTYFYGAHVAPRSVEDIVP